MRKHRRTHTHARREAPTVRIEREDPEVVTRRMELKEESLGRLYSQYHGSKSKASLALAREACQGLSRFE
jgi:hypothetical protein